MITDWNDAYANVTHIPNGEAYFDAWESDAVEFRQQMISENRAEFDIQYGTGSREVFDLFRPADDPKGLMIFIHGGYWMKFDKNRFSHLAKGAVGRGWNAVVPSYDLAPDIRISSITRQITEAVEKAAKAVPGPIHLAGHSAGGHLASRMICQDSALASATLERIKCVISISGLHDLRPLLRTALNDTLKLDETEARTESAAFHEPLPGPRIVAWVGSDERPEFVRQNDLLANIWTGLGADISSNHDVAKHHFDVIDGLTDPDSPLTEALLG